MGYVTSDHDKIEDEAEDRGYKRAVNDIIDWHKNELAKLDESIRKAFVGPPGREIQVGVVWEGKYCSAAELKELVHYHTEMVKALKEKFVK
jgi:hypothetical protein